MNTQRKISLAALVALLTIHACTAPASQESVQERKVNLIYTDWSEAIALTNLAKILLEEQMAFEVQMKLTDVETAYAEVASGKADVFADAWLPETHKHYLETHANAIEQLGIIYPHARTGLVVPAYSQYQSIEDLKNKDIEIVGIETEAGVMYQTRYAIDQYGLDQAQLHSLSEQDMTEAFSESFKRREEIVITGWEPHWLFARYELRFLDDPMQVFGAQENIYAVGNKSLPERLPTVARFFERMQLSERQINSLIYFMHSEADPEDGVREWIHKNEYIVNQWVKNLKPERKKIM